MLPPFGFFTFYFCLGLPPLRRPTPPLPRPPPPLAPHRRLRRQPLRHAALGLGELLHPALPHDPGQARRLHACRAAVDLQLLPRHRHPGAGRHRRLAAPRTARVAARRHRRARRLACDGAKGLPTRLAEGCMPTAGFHPLPHQVCPAAADGAAILGSARMEGGRCRSQCRRRRFPTDFHRTALNDERGH